jgi:hypothetical protein
MPENVTADCQYFCLEFAGLPGKFEPWFSADAKPMTNVAIPVACAFQVAAWKIFDGRP